MRGKALVIYRRNRGQMYLAGGSRCSNFGQPPVTSGTNNLSGWSVPEFWQGNFLYVRAGCQFPQCCTPEPVQIKRVRYRQPMTGRGFCYPKPRLAALGLKGGRYKFTAARKELTNWCMVVAMSTTTHIH